MDDDDQLDAGLFEEPADFAPPKPPTVAKHLMKSGHEVPIHLVGYNLREGHYLWNGARYVSHWFEDNVSAIKDKTVFELGAGGGLPSIVAAILGARKVVCTDYPDEELLVMIRKNVDESAALIPEPKSRIVAEGYEWGVDPKPIIAHLDDGEEGFDILILADLLFKHPQHANMVKTIEMTLSKKRDSKALVFFTSYRPWLQQADLAFFDRARDHGFNVEKIFEQRLEKPMFENDPGDLEIQKLCTGWEISWPEDKCSP
ncbi:nicotinamide n-methyltransferase [Seiridium cupressi]